MRSSTGRAAEGSLAANRRIRVWQPNLAGRTGPAPAGRVGPTGPAGPAGRVGRVEPTPAPADRAEAVPAVLARPAAARTTTARPRDTTTGRATTAEGSPSPP